MANEIELAYGTSGRNLYAIIRTTTGGVWNGASFVAFNQSNWTTYAVTMTEQGTSGYYLGDFPVVSPGVYNLEVRDRSGGSPAATDPLAGSGSIDWIGSAVQVIPDLTGFVSDYNNGLLPVNVNDLQDGTMTADALLGRNGAGGSSGGKTVAYYIQGGPAKIAFDVPTAGKFTIYGANGTTILNVGDYTSSAGASPVITLTPG